MLSTKSWKKALILQSLFFYGFAFGQNIFIDKPAPGEALADTQEFVVSVTDTSVERVDFYLNGRLLQARKNPPYRFRAAWNTRYKNKVRFVATLPDGKSLEVTREFSEIEVDVEEKLEAFQFFPFVEQPGAVTKLYSAGNQIKPQTMARADRFRLHLVIVLDISGSMKFSLAEVSTPLLNLIAQGKQNNWDVRFMVFDRNPRLINIDAVPNNLEDLYTGFSKSVVWDALATASQLFPKGSRRVMMLVSDGRDDGSVHDSNSAGQYVKEALTPLIWINPSSLQNVPMNRLTDLSGGISFFLQDRNFWPLIARLLENQYHVVAPDAVWPIRMTATPGRVWYPKWKE